MSADSLNNLSSCIRFLQVTTGKTDCSEMKELFSALLDRMKEKRDILISKVDDMIEQMRKNYYSLKVSDSVLLSMIDQYEHRFTEIIKKLYADSIRIVDKYCSVLVYNEGFIIEK